MMDDEDRTPDLPLGESWRFGLGARYDWSKNLAFGLGYTLLWSGDLDMELTGELWREGFRGLMRTCQ